MSAQAPKESDLAEPFIVSPGHHSKEKESSNSGPCCCKCCRCCTWKKCGIISAVVVVAIGLILAAGALRYYMKLQGTASSEDSEVWEERLQGEDEAEHLTKMSKSILDGEYSMVSYDENYREYLAGLGVPQLVVGMVLSARESVTYRAPRRSQGLWVKFTKTDLDDGKRLEFQLDNPFTDSLGSRRIVYYNTTCSLSGEKNNILTCDAVSTDGSVELNSVAVFNRKGFIETKTLRKSAIEGKSGIVAKKYFSRESPLESANHQSDDDDDRENELDEEIKSAKEKEAKNPKDKIFSEGDPFDEFDRKK